MTISEYKASIRDKQMPLGISVHLKALWYDAVGDWDKAHSLIDSLPDKDSAFLHAYLHRKEGDQFNADYWYRRAGKPRFSGSLDEEWLQLVAYFIGD